MMRFTFEGKERSFELVIGTPPAEGGDSQPCDTECDCDEPEDKQGFDFRA